MKPLTVALLFGGQSNEHAVSCRSALTVFNALQAGGYTVLPIGITQKGEWLLLRADPKALADPNWENAPDLHPLTLAPDGWLCTHGGRAYRPDVAFPVLHGQGGEDGKVQGFLHCWGVPYVGCGVEASALSMNKILAKRLAKEVGVPTLPWWRCTPDTSPEELSPHLPLFIKAVRSGSSLGAAAARTEEELPVALSQALSVDGEALAEPFFSAKEVEVAVFDDGIRTVSEPAEIETGAVFYDFDTKYKSGTARTYLPARIGAAQTALVKQYASLVFDTLGCRHLSRVDFFVSPTHIYFNEINTMPGFTPDSLYARMMERAGIDLPTLTARLVEAAYRDRHLR